MTQLVFSAPAKLILCGEHAVVYGHPAIALPLHGLQASISVDQHTSGLVFDAPDLGRHWQLDAQADDALSELARATLAELNAPIPAARLTIRSQIPIASGLGSGAAIGVALVRALAAISGHELSAAQVSALVYHSEQRFHGTPSGIDNTVIAYEQAIWFQRGNPPTLEPLRIGGALQLLIADTGVRSETRLPVGDLRQRWSVEPERYNRLFEAVGALVRQIRVLLERGAPPQLGSLLNENQQLLEQLGVSSPELRRLIMAAREAGALGAKLSGAGWGGVILALVTPEQIEQVHNALQAAGAARVWYTELRAQ